MTAPAKCGTVGNMSEIQTAIQALIDKHGSLRAAARAIDISAAYLSRLRRGKKDNPGTKALRRIGLVKAVTYSRRK
jgi:transcriptional regulator with XRE-family HTH domain